MSKIETIFPYSVWPNVRVSVQLTLQNVQMLLVINLNKQTPMIHR